MSSDDKKVLGGIDELLTKVGNDIQKQEPESPTPVVDQTLVSLASVSPGGTERIPPPAEGIHLDVPFDTYRKWDAVNASAIAWGTVSMEHMRACLDGMLHKESPAMDFGKALHCKLLEPEKFRDLYVVSEPCSSIIKSTRSKNYNQPCGKTGICSYAGQWFCGVHAPDNATTPKHVLSPKEYAAVMAIERKVQKHDVSRVFAAGGGFEASVVWRWNGLVCKARVDKLTHIDDGNTIVDLKKVAVGRITRSALERSVSDYQYDMKAAFYTDAVRYVREQVPAFVWAFVEDSFPFSITAIQANTITIEIGRFLYERTLKRWIECLETDTYPGCSWDWEQGRNVIKEGGSPAWRQRLYHAGEL